MSTPEDNIPFLAILETFWSYCLTCLEFRRVLMEGKQHVGWNLSHCFLKTKEILMGAFF